MVPAKPPPGCPPGLQHLTMLDQILVEQKVTIKLGGLETANKYKVFNSLDQQVYDAKEDTDCFTWLSCDADRPFNMYITDMQGQEVIHLKRPLRCLPCCLQELEVSSPPGSVIGKIEQKWSIIYPNFVIKDQVSQMSNSI